MAAKFNESIEKLVVWGANSYILPEEVEIYESTYGKESEEKYENEMKKK